MSKVSSTSYPSYSNSSVSVGDSTASTGVKNGILTTNYDMSGNEAAIYNYALGTLASILPQLNTFDANTQSQIDSEVGAYKDSGMQTINNLYNSNLNNLENDAVTRFGNLDNSIFTDNLSNLESERSNAVSSFAQDVLAKQSSLASDELTKRYALVNLLSGLSNNIYSNALDAISTTLGSSSSANNYNNDLYNALSAIENTNAKSANATTSALSSLLGGGGSGTSLSSLLSLL